MQQVSLKDFQCEMTSNELQQILGHKTYDQLCHLFGATRFQIKLRRILPDPKFCIPFHLDVNRKTLQVILNTCKGGEVLYVLEKHCLPIQRTVGTVVIHEANVLHAVNPVEEERFALFFLVK